MRREEQLKKIQAADESYYGSSGKTIMSDAEYDALRRDYIDKYGSEDLDYVPGADLGGKKFTHPSPAKSLGKIDELETDKLIKYLDQFKPAVIEPKLDGCSIVVYPQDGKPVYVTRGGGNEGDILTRFPVHPRTTPFRAEHPIRGEVYMSFASFEQMNEELEKAGEEPMANPRNSVNPILTGGQHPEFVKYLSFQAYDVMGVDWSETDKIEYILANTPFDVPPLKRYEQETAAQIAEHIPALYKNYEDTLGYPIDGIVIKCDWPDSLREFGTTDHHDNNAIAWKPSQIPQETTITGVHWQLGKTGQLTPVADMEPVEILGSTVSNASLHNVNVINRLGGIAVGDKVGVIKAKLIIPQIVIVYEHNDGEALAEPKHCPFCGGKLKKRKIASVNADDGGYVLYCTNPRDPEMIAQQIAFLANKSVLNIDRLSIGNARQLVSTFPDLAETYGPYMIFELTEDEIRQALILSDDERKSRLTADPVSPGKLWQAIDACRTGVDIPRFIKALCIENIGENIGTLLAGRFGTIDHILEAVSCDLEDKEAVAAKIDELTGGKKKKSGIDGIGKTIARLLISEDFARQVGTLRKYIEPEAFEVVEKPRTAYTDKIFVLTGTMPHSRRYYTDLIKAAGGVTASAVSGKTDYLVIADVNSTSTKAEKARRLGTTLVSPEQLEEMLQN